MKKMADSREGQQAIEANKSHIDIFVPLPPIASWKMIERISLNIGRKHYCATSVEDLLGLDRVRAGDRVVVTMAKDDFEQERRQAAESGRGSSIEGKIKSLRNAGAMVEVQEILFLMEFGNSVMLLDMKRTGLFHLRHVNLLALVRYSGGYSPGVFALNLANSQLPSVLVEVGDLEISISRDISLVLKQKYPFKYQMVPWKVTCVSRHVSKWNPMSVSVKRVNEPMSWIQMATFLLSFSVFA
jgi:hypothetical protein